MLNEFRQDPVSGEWVLFSTARAKKPHPDKEAPFFQAKEECFFEPERISEQEAPVAVYRKGELVEELIPDWTTIVFPNKYPVVENKKPEGNIQNYIFGTMAAHGHHELVVTRDHERSIAQFSNDETLEVVRAYRDRYLEISKDPNVAYVSVFHNHGRLAGASIFHNHSQIIAMPVVSASVERHIVSAKKYFEGHGKKVHQTIIDWEMTEQKRIVYENANFVALCPFASGSEYEVRIFPKRDCSNFGEIADEEMPALANILTTVLKKLNKALNNVDYAYFIHTANDKIEGAEFYRWHLEILPRVSIDAGLELGTNIVVNTVDPDEAAALLRDTLI